VDWQIFSAGRVRSNIELQKALQQEAMLAYQETVLTALADVEHALVAYAKEHERHKTLTDAVAYNRKAVDSATQLYKQGLTDFLNVLIAQRSLFASEDALVQSTRNLSIDLVALYKALGGGWDCESVEH
jgi:outer membrane protein TolC